MSSTTESSFEALCHSARDISRHIAGMAEELLSMRHADPDQNSEMAARQVAKMRDQATLLDAVLRDIAKAG